MSTATGNILFKEEKVQSKRPALTIFCIILFLCALTVGEVYLLYRSSRNGPVKVEKRDDSDVPAAKARLQD